MEDDLSDVVVTIGYVERYGPLAERYLTRWGRP